VREQFPQSHFSDRFCRGFVGEKIALIQLSKQQATGIRGYPTTGKIGDDFFGDKTFKTELFKADYFPRVSCPRSCLFCDYSILADTLSFFKNVS